jgi:hypothetical protein
MRKKGKRKTDQENVKKEKEKNRIQENEKKKTK